MSSETSESVSSNDGSGIQLTYFVISYAYDSKVLACAGMTWNGVEVTLYHIIQLDLNKMDSQNIFWLFKMRFGIIFLLALFCSSQIFANDVDISDIEQTLDADSKDEPAKDADYKNDQINTNNVTSEKDSQIAKLVSAEPHLEASKAKLIVLNKITAKSSEYILKIGEVKFFGNLSIQVHKCIKATDPYNSNNLMLLTISDNKIEEDNVVVFHGWLVSSNPSLSTLEHPVYEVIPLDCMIQ